MEQLEAIISERLSANQLSRVTANPGFDLVQVASSRVERARAHIARGEEIVGRQSDTVRRLAQIGSDTVLATRMLLIFEESLTVMHRHLAREELETSA